MEIVEHAKQAFQDRFGVEPEVAAFAPGRINLIGEHTDYNDGFVFPVAIDRGIAVVASRTEDAGEMLSLQAGEGVPFDCGALRPGWPDSWTVYPAGMAWALERDLGRRPPNIRAVVHGDLPFASGVSSSAAIEVAFGRIYERLMGADIEPLKLAQIAQVCEREYVGVNCGLMDMAASACGRAGYAMLFDTRSLEIRHVPIPEGLSIVLCDTATPRALSASAYNERRAQCEAAAAALGVSSLRDADLALLERKKQEMDEVVYRRARHVVTENARCLAFVEALTLGDENTLGKLMLESHESLRTDYEVSSFELDCMAELARETVGCLGARMTGAGFGGACVALVRESQLSTFLEASALRYLERSERSGVFMACRTGDGARSVG